MPESANLFVARQIERLRRIPKRKKIVFPESGDLRVQAAAERLSREGLVDPILAIDRDYSSLYFERRRWKGVTQADAERIVQNPLYRAALMVAAGDADGAVGGAVNTTAETVRAALHCIGTAPGMKTVSGAFFICVEDRGFGHDGVLVFADCAMVIDPTPDELADIAISSAQSARAVVG